MWLIQNDEVDVSIAVPGKFSCIRDVVCLRGQTGKPLRFRLDRAPNRYVTLSSREALSRLSFILFCDVLVISYLVLLAEDNFYRTSNPSMILQGLGCGPRRPGRLGPRFHGVCGSVIGMQSAYSVEPGESRNRRGCLVSTYHHHSFFGSFSIATPPNFPC